MLSTIEIPVWFAVLAGVFYSGYLTASRWLSGTVPALTLLVAQLAVGAVVLAPIGLAEVPAVNLTVMALTGLSGCLSALGNLLLLKAYQGAEATRLAPFVYLQLIAATVLGLLVFGDLPDGLSLIGMGILMASGFGSLAVRRGAKGR